MYGIYINAKNSITIKNCVIRHLGIEMEGEASYNPNNKHKPSLKYLKKAQELF